MIVDIDNEISREASEGREIWGSHRTWKRKAGSWGERKECGWGRMRLEGWEEATKTNFVQKCHGKTYSFVKLIKIK